METVKQAVATTNARKIYARSHKLKETRMLHTIDCADLPQLLRVRQWQKPGYRLHIEIVAPISSYL